MKVSKFLPATLALAIGIATSSVAVARTITVELSNLTHGMYFTPRLAAAHADTVNLFELGAAASTGLRTMAETGNPGVLAGELPAEVIFAVDASGTSPTIAAGVPRILGPGGSATITLNDVADADVMFSIAAMLMPTNDAFVGLDSFAVPAGTGTYTFLLNAYDAGTEANTELVLPAALRPEADCNGLGDESSATCGNESYIPFHPDASNSSVFNVGLGGAGVVAATSSELNVVHIHRNVIGDFDSAAGASDLDATFHRWLNPVGQVTITVSE
jgi:hypothetical protein